MSAGEAFYPMPPQELIEALAKDCRCCPECRTGSIPCDGLLAGGPCDEARCECDDETGDDYDEEDCR